MKTPDHTKRPTVKKAVAHTSARGCGLWVLTPGAQVNRRAPHSRRRCVLVLLLIFDQHATGVPIDGLREVRERSCPRCWFGTLIGHLGAVPDGGL